MNRRKSSNPYVTRGRLQFRMLQILLNAVALLIIAGGLAAYFNAYPTVKFVNKTIITQQGYPMEDMKESSLMGTLLLISSIQILFTNSCSLFRQEPCTGCLPTDNSKVLRKCSV